MRALAYHGYGDRSILALQDLPDPGAPSRGEVRVRVHASSINPVDGKVRRGELKLIAGGHFPKRPGLDFSGTVEAIGEGVSWLRIGDAVFGAARSMSEGAFADYVLVKATAIAKCPSSMDRATAAAVPTVAVAALQAVRDLVKAATGDHILVNGCAGGVGLYALQFAKHFGATVTGVCASRDLSLAREFGAHEVFDYRSGDAFHGTMYRAILELSGKLAFEAAAESLEEGGVYVDFSPSPGALIGNSIANPFRSRKHIFAMTSATTEDLDWIAQEVDGGRLRTGPTRIFSLEHFADAFALAEGGGFPGKVVVRIASDI